MQEDENNFFVKMDGYLSSLGLYRKRVARESSCLFRAVSEQLYYSQNYHQKIRQECVDYIRANRCVFEPFIESSFEKYLERLEDPRETVGLVEIKALSQLYRRCFLIYRYPWKPATVISEDDFEDKVMLCCSFSGHYDIVYPRSYSASAAACQSLPYKLLYTRLSGVEEAELLHAMKAYRNSSSVCRNVDVGNDTPEDRGQSREEMEAGGVADEKPRAEMDDTKPPAEAPLPSRLSLPYKVMKSPASDVYRNVGVTRKEMQKKSFTVFEGRKYFLGDECQVRLEPRGKYYNGFIQEVGPYSTAVTVFIEELGEKHLVPLTDLKLVNPVAAWNIAASTRKGHLDPHGQHHQHHRYFRKSQGRSRVPPHFQPAGHPCPPSTPSRGAMTYDPYAPPHHHPPAARPPRDGASSRSQRQLVAAWNKECQFDFLAETVEEPADLYAAIPYHQLDEASDATSPPLPGPAVALPPTMGAPPPHPGSSYRVQRGSGTPSPPPPPGNTPISSEEEEEQEDTSTVEDQEEHIYSAQDQSYQTSGVYTAAEPSTNQVVKPLAVTWSFPSSHAPAAAHLQPTAHTQPHSAVMAIPSTSPWLFNELGEPLCTAVAPPPYSYDPNGSDLPGDCRVLQYYFNLGLQWYHQSLWQRQQQQQQTYPPPPLEAAYTYQYYSPYLSQDPHHGLLPIVAPNSYPETSRSSHQPESTRAGEGQIEGHSSGPAPIVEGSTSSSISLASTGSAPSAALLYSDQTPLPLPQCSNCLMKFRSWQPTCPPGLTLHIPTLPTSPITPPTIASPCPPIGGRLRPEGTPHGFIASPQTLPMQLVTSQPPPPPPNHTATHYTPHYIYPTHHAETFTSTTSC